MLVIKKQKTQRPSDPPPYLPKEIQKEEPDSGREY